MRNPTTKSEAKTKKPNDERPPAQPLPYLVDTALKVEKLRVAAEVRQAHLARQGRQDHDTDELHHRLRELEDFVDSKVAALIVTHPAYPWFSRVKGVGRENIGKVVGLIDITKADTVSALWKFAGFAVTEGKAEKPQSGKKLSYNAQLRSMCWRLGGSLLRGKGVFYSYYLKEKERLQLRYEAQGTAVLPTPPSGSAKRIEPEGVIYQGHLHNQALRKMIKLFLQCLWVTWREAEGLPTRVPYVSEYLGHSHIIDAWEMVDREG